MNTVELIHRKKNTYSVPEIRKMLGLGKTESYWILQHRPFEVTRVSGQMRVLKSSFDDWYDNQVKYKKVDGSPPGTALKAWSYSVQEAAEILAISDTTVYLHLEKWGLETFTVDSVTRITKDSFERWYASQDKYRNAEDREKDLPLLDDSYSMQEMRRMLGIHRNGIYNIVAKEGPNGFFEYVYVAGQKRVTKSSFWAWYHHQSYYHITDSIEEAEAFKPFNSHRKKERQSEPEPVKKPIPVKSSYRVKDLMDALGIEKKEAYALIQGFKIKAIKAGKSFIIPASSFHALLEERGLTDGIDQEAE